ncbi:MAG: L-threonylcarbamoyladenylate synthase [Gammaproteobacteria bacterium]|nr:L-threonylcarbamoyladenylate synthase [Gammaproteobacteria bacterium]
MNRWHLNRAARILKRGGVIAYPTEAVYGLGCVPENYVAVARILCLKRRPINKGLILIAGDPEQLAMYISFPSQAVRDQVMNSWPGPVTWILPATKAVPPWITGNRTTVAVRVSKHDQVRELCRIAGALVSTSANPSHYPPATSARKVMMYFDHTLDYILPGKVGPESRPTEIRDAITGMVLRQGG